MQNLLKRETIENAFIISVICTIFTLPHLCYLSFVMIEGRVAIQILITHLWSILIVSFLCSAFGLAWSRVYGLGGIIVDFERFKRWLPFILLLSFIIGTGSFVVQDIHLSIHLPYLYPKNPLFSLTIPLKAAFFQEVIRFGGMALVCRLTKNLHLSNLIISIFFLYLGTRFISFAGLGLDQHRWLLLAFGWSFIVNLIMGYMYAKLGIVSTMTIQFVASLRFLLFTKLSFSFIS